MSRGGGDGNGRAVDGRGCCGQKANVTFQFMRTGLMQDRNTEPPMHNGDILLRFFFFFFFACCVTYCAVMCFHLARQPDDDILNRTSIEFHRFGGKFHLAALIGSDCFLMKDHLKI